MKTRLVTRVVFVTLLSTCALFGGGQCGPGPNGPVKTSGDGYSPVAANGSVETPSGSSMDPSSLTVTAGALAQAKPDNLGRFRIDANRLTTQLLSARTPAGDPYLMAIAITPSAEASLPLDTRTTAEALIFLSPAAVVSDPSLSNFVMTIIESMAETQQLAQVLSSKLASDPGVLSKDDPAVQEAVTRAVTRFVSKIDSAAEVTEFGRTDTVVSAFLAAKHWSEPAEVSSQQQQVQIENLIITPSTSQSGITLVATAIDANNYKIKVSNSKKRYVDAYLDEGTTTLGHAFLQSRKSLVS